MKTTKTNITVLLAAFGLAGVFSANAQAPKYDFEKQLLPFFQKRCMECHGKNKEGKKPKGDFNMTTPEGFVKGGKEEGPGITKGDPTKSSVYTLIMMAIDEEKVMPPKKAQNKDGPVPETGKAAIKAWIEQGADFGAWKGEAK